MFVVATETVVDVPTSSSNLASRLTTAEKTLDKPTKLPSTKSTSNESNGSVNLDDCHWEELFDDDGEFVNKTLIQEVRVFLLTAAHLLCVICQY